MPVTVLDANGLGQDSDVIAGVIWAADHGADVIVMAFSNPGFSQNLQDALDYAWSKNVVLVAATGNDALSTPTFPAGDRGVMGVAGTDPNDALVPFSSYGPSVFIAAPATEILTTGIGDAYTVISGTSASAAIVAGAAAFMKAVDPTLTNGIIVGRLARNADPAGTQWQTGNGRINLARALADTSVEFIQPAGAAPVGTGGPFVGPYAAAASTLASVSVSPQSGALTFGTGGSATYVVTINRTGNGSLDVSLAVTSALPAGATASFSPSTVSFSGGIPLSKTSTLTILTSSSTPAGTTNFTIRACASANPACPGNPTVVTTTGSLLVNKADQTITFGVLAGKTYGDPDFGVSATTSSGLAVSFTSQTTATCTVSGSTVHIVAAGTCTIRASQAGNGNYNAAPTVDQSFTINQKAASVTPNAASKTYGDADPSPLTTGTLTGFLAADGVTATYSRTAGETVAGSPYTISATLSPAGVLGNYTITSNTANFTITPKTASVTPNAASKTYGAADPTLSGTLSSFLAGDNVTATYSRTAGETVAGSPYTIGATLSPTGVLGNYTITYNTANFTISTATLKVTADNQTKQYSDPLQAFTVTYDGFVLGEGPSNLSGTPPSCITTPTATATSGPGPYAIRCSGQTSPNY